MSGAAPRALIVSCYELGRQPLAAASALAFLQRAAIRVEALDLAVERLEDRADALREFAPQLIAISVPMHTALQIGLRTAERLRALAPGAHVCFYGMYAALNADHLLEHAADSVLSGESEPVLIELARALDSGATAESVEGLHLAGRPANPLLQRLAFPTPHRAQLPGHEQYAQLEIDGERRSAAAIETSRGCLHRCRHCPLPAVYDGRFFVVSREAVLDDVRRLVADGVRHLTFADPDFFNGPRHSMQIALALRGIDPGLTFDLTTKVEHLLEHRAHLTELRDAGCVFIVSAVESLSDLVLEQLDKGHTRRDVQTALELTREHGLDLRPTFVPFTPWGSAADYLELLDWIAVENLVERIEPVQLSIRLLVPPGSLLENLPSMLPHLRGLRADRLSHDWAHPDPRMDELQRVVAALVADGARTDEPAARTFERVRAESRRLLAAEDRPLVPIPPRAIDGAPPRMTEPWFC